MIIDKAIIDRRVIPCAAEILVARRVEQLARERMTAERDAAFALDRDSTLNVVNLLKETTVADGTAVVMVTHDHRIIDAADRLVHMVDGRIMSDMMLHDALRICEFLRPIDLFKTLTPRQLTDVAEKMTRRRFAAGDAISPRGEERRGVFPGFRRRG